MQRPLFQWARCAADLSTAIIRNSGSTFVLSCNGSSAGRFQEHFDPPFFRPERGAVQSNAMRAFVKNWQWILLSTAIVMLATWVASQAAFQMTESRILSRFDQVKVGMDRRQVESIMEVPPDEEWEADKKGHRI